MFLLSIVACSDKRKGLPESQRNYAVENINSGDSSCMTASDGLFQFHNINADTVLRLMANANVKYFGENFDTQEIRDTISNRLQEFFSTKTALNTKWTLYCTIDKTKFSGNYHSFYSLENLGIDLFFENQICLKKLIEQVDTCRYIEDNSGTSFETKKNKFRFLCYFNIDIRYRPRSLFNNGKKEYYRETIKDTVDVYTALDAANFIYK
jgi:hypothetical protein